MTEVATLREKLTSLKKCMTKTAMLLRKFSDRLTSGEIIDCNDYDNITSMISNLLEMQKKFCVDLSDISNGANNPLSLEEANALIAEIENRFDRESLIKLLEKFKHVSAKDGYAKSLLELVEELERLCKKEPLDNTNMAVSCYESLFSAIMSNNNDERVQLLEKCESYFHPEIITAVMFNRFYFDGKRTPVFAGVVKEDKVSEKSVCAADAVHEKILPAEIDDASDNAEPSDRSKSLGRTVIEGNSKDKLPSKSKTSKNKNQSYDGKDRANKQDLINIEKFRFLNLNSEIKNPAFPYNVKGNLVPSNSNPRIDRQILATTLPEIAACKFHKRIKIEWNHTGDGTDDTISDHENIIEADTVRTETAKCDKRVESTENSFLQTNSKDDQYGNEIEDILDAREALSDREQATDGDDRFFQDKIVPIETIRQNLLHMLGDGKLYCACAYLGSEKQTV